MKGAGAIEKNHTRCLLMEPLGTNKGSDEFSQCDKENREGPSLDTGASVREG